MKEEESADLGEFEVLRKMRAHHLAYPVDRFHDGVVEIVDYWNSEASFEELHDGVGAYETGTTGDQNLLGGGNHFGEREKKEIMESESENENENENERNGRCGENLWSEWEKRWNEIWNV